MMFFNFNLIKYEVKVHLIPTWNTRVSFLWNRGNLSFLLFNFLSSSS